MQGSGTWNALDGHYTNHFLPTTIIRIIRRGVVSPNKQGFRMPKTSFGMAGKANDETPAELQEMANAINALPARYRDAVLPALDRVVECSTRRRRILNLVQEALSQLRLDMKYLIFDLEATRRERDQYKEQLEKDGL